MNGTCFQEPIGFIKFSISPEFVPLLMDKDLLHKIFVSLREIKQELYAKSFQVNDLRENLPPHVENARRKPQKVTRKTCHVTSSGWRLAVNSDLKLFINFCVCVCVRQHQLCNKLTCLSKLICKIPVKAIYRRV